MSRPVVPTCDECGRVKQETNHWWTAFVNANPGVNCLEFSPYQHHSGIPVGFRLYDLCSEECAHKLLAKWMRGELTK